MLVKVATDQYRNFYFGDGRVVILSPRGNFIHWLNGIVTLIQALNYDIFIVFCVSDVAAAPEVLHDYFYAESYHCMSSIISEIDWTQIQNKL